MGIVMRVIPNDTDLEKTDEIPVANIRLNLSVPLSLSEVKSAFLNLKYLESFWIRKFKKKRALIC